jgi:hypothetical protein
MAKGSTSKGNMAKRQPKKRRLSLSDDSNDDVQAEVVARPHSASLHTLKSADVAPLRTNLLEWFTKTRDVRGMPWRQHVMEMSPEKQAQRAYEVSDLFDGPPANRELE